MPTSTARSWVTTASLPAFSTTIRRNWRPISRACEIGRQFLLMVVENAGRLAVVTHERAVDVGILHERDDGVPAGLVEAVLKRVARGVTTGADIAHEPFHAL